MTDEEIKANFNDIALIKVIHKGDKGNKIYLDVNIDHEMSGTEIQNNTVLIAVFEGSHSVELTPINYLAGQKLIVPIQVVKNLNKGDLFEVKVDNSNGSLDVKPAVKMSRVNANAIKAYLAQDNK